MSKITKEAWQKLDNLFLGNKSIQQSKYETALDQAEEFVMQDDESPEDLYRRLTALAVTLTECGDKQVDDAWIKRKFLKAITPSRNLWPPPYGQERILSPWTPTPF